METQSTSVSNRNGKVIWAGRVVSALPVLMLLFSGSMKKTALQSQPLTSML